MLELVRERENIHDNCAIALHFNKNKIGYIPMESNEILSRLIDSGVIDLHAEITNLKPEAASWENAHIAVYLLKEQKNTGILPNAGYLTMLETPEYRSMKRKDNNISRIYYNNNIEEEILNGDDFYKALVDNSETDEVYDLIHNSFPAAQEMENAVTDMKMVINKNKLPHDLANDKLIKPLDDAILQLDNIFKEDGYVVANINRIASLSPRIEKFVQVLDNSGRCFYEVVFKGLKN